MIRRIDGLILYTSVPSVTSPFTACTYSRLNVCQTIICLEICFVSDTRLITLIRTMFANASHNRQFFQCLAANSSIHMYIPPSGGNDMNEDNCILHLQQDVGKVVTFDTYCHIYHTVPSHLGPFKTKYTTCFHCICQCVRTYSPSLHVAATLYN